MEHTVASGDGLLKEVVNGRKPFSPTVAQYVFKRYIALLYRLCVEENNQYDVLVGPGDSGAVMVYFAELFYKAVQKPLPPKLILPVQRYVDADNEATGLYDNSVLLPSAVRQLAGLSVSRALFVDDEIWQANSASACARLLADALPESTAQNRVVFTIIAENHGFEWHHDIPPIAIQYYAFSKRIVGINNAVLRFLIADQQQALNEFTKMYLDPTEVDGQTRKMDLLCNGQVKIPSRTAGVAPAFREVAANVDLTKLKSQVEGELMLLIREAVAEYKQKHIVFVF